MIVTATPTDPTRSAFVRFTWTTDLEDCDMVALGVDDTEINTLLEAKVHEGVELEGWIVKIS